MIEIQEFLEWIDREMEKETRPDGTLTDFGCGMLIIKTKIEEKLKEKQK